QLNIQLSSVPKNGQLIIYNELGQLQKIYSNINSRTASFDITSFSNGQYMAVLRDGDRTIATKFLITK
ncbi:MAG: T9SS type A sorting domain-containing protein, partial [Saprospiraceae bacterium]